MHGQTHACQPEYKMPPAANLLAEAKTTYC